MLKPARNSTTSWRDLDRRHHLHPFTDYRALAEEGGSRIIVKGEGAWLEDSEGNQILDGMAGLWCVNVGYGRKELADAAYQQMLELPYYNTFFKTATPPAVELAERLVALMPDGLSHVFYGSSGSEGNDTVVRLVRRYWDLIGKPDKKTFISREYAYHGSTIAGTSLGGQPAMHAQAGLLPGFVHVMPPYRYALGGDLSEAEFARKATKAIEDKILELGADNVAAFIGEPIMGAGGVIIAPEGYWPEVQRICRKHDVLLVIDEVISGFGRIGEWCASHHYGLEPDLLTLAKGITSGYVPLSASIARRHLADAFPEGGTQENVHPNTYAAHPVACAAALANLRIMEQDRLVENAETMGAHLLTSLQAAVGHRSIVGEVRGRGLMVCVDLVDPDGAGRPLEAKRVADLDRHAWERGAIVYARGSVVRLAPPLCISRAEVDQLVAIVADSVDALAKG
jgi:putrescine---pyruvate transaminase